MAYCAPNLKNSNEEQLPQVSVSSFFNNYKQAKYNKVMDFIIGEIFRKYVGEKGWTVVDLAKEENLKLVYKGIKAYMENMIISHYNDSDGMWKNLSEEAINDLDLIIENFDVFAKEHAQYNNITNTKDFNLNDELSEEEQLDNDAEGKDENAEDDTETEENKGKEYDKIGNEQSQMELASKDVRVIFRLLPKAEYNPKTKKAEIVFDRDGLPTSAEFVATWNLLMERTQGQKDYEKFKKILQSEKTRQIVPEVEFINQILKIEKPDNLKSPSEVRQFINFYQRFSKPKITIKSQFKDSTGIVTLSDEILGNKMKIENQFRNNFVEGNVPENYKKYVKRSATGVYLLAKLDESDENFLPPVPHDHETRMGFLGLLGIQFTGLNMMDDTEKEEFETMIAETAPRLYATTKERLEMGIQMKEPVKELKAKMENSKSEKTSIQRIVEFESRYSRISPTHSSRNSVGELQHLISQDSALSLTTTDLNNSANLEELYTKPSFRNAKHNSQMKDSYIIKFLFDTNGDKIPGRRIELELISGQKTQLSEGKTVSNLERNLSEKNKLIQDYNNFLLYGKTDIMRTETSQSFYMVGLYDKNQSVRYVDIKGFSTSFMESKQFKTQILNYLKGEVLRVNSFAEKKKQNPSIQAGYGEFAIFSEVFSNNKELKERVLKEKLEYDSTVFNDFLNEYEKILNTELSNFKSLRDKLGIKDQELFSKQLVETKQEPDALHRAFIAGSLIQNIEFSILYTGDTIFYKDLHKRLKGLSSTGNVAADIELLREYFKSPYETQYYSNYGLGGAMKIERRDNNDNYKSQTLKEYPMRNFAYLDKNLPDQIKKSLMMRDGGVGKYTDEFIDDLLSGAKDQKPADGEGYMNLDFHRELAHRFGFHTPEMEIAYKYEGLIFRRDILGEKLTNAQQTELELLEEKIYSEPDVYALPVLKLTYWGAIENTTVDTKAYDKFSTAPILPSIARNHPDLKKILVDLVKGQYGYVKYESGTKLFKTTPVESLKGAEPDLLTTQLLKEQIKTNNDQKIATTIPTQLLKLIFSNLFDSGVAKTPKAKVLYDKYISVLKTIQTEQGKKLLKDLGISLEGDNVDIDRKLLKEKLLNEAKRQQFNSNIITALDSIDTINPETSGFQKEIGNLISGVVDKTLRKFKFTGGDFILVTNANMSPLKWYKFSENGTSACGCRITLTKEFSKLLKKIHPDGTYIRTLDRLNKLLKDKDWVKENEKSLTIVLDRVPTQGPNSMDFAIIEEFLSPTAGNVVVLPDEIVFKSGTDFDYDKEKVLTPSLSDNGDYLETEFDSIEDINKELDSLIKLKFKTIQDARRHVSSLRQEVRDINIVLKRDLKSIRNDIENLKIERDIYIEYIKDWIEGLANDSENPQNYREYNKKKGNDFLNALFTVNNAELLREMNADVIKYYEIAKELDDNYSELKDYVEVFKEIKEENLNRIYEIKEGELSASMDFSERIFKLFEVRRNFLGVNGNRIISVYKDTLSLPEMFADLISPNSNMLTKALAERTAKNTGKSITLPSLGRTLYYTENLKVFKTFFDAKGLLGPFAKDNTFQQLLTYLGINLNESFRTYSSKTKSYDVIEKVNNLLLTKEEASKVFKDGKVITSLRDDVEGYTKQQWNSETINATVDAAKDPFFALMKIVWENVGVVNLLKNQGVPFERIVDFINHPTLQYYFSLRQNGMNKKDAIVKLAQERLSLSTVRRTVEVPDLKTFFTYKLPTEQLLKKGLINKDETVVEHIEDNGKYSIVIARNAVPEYKTVMNIFKQIDNNGKVINKSYEYLNKWINNNEITPERIKFLANPENDRQKVRQDPNRKGENIPMFSDEIRIVSHFFNLETANNAFRDFQKYFNFDTHKISSLIEINAKENLRVKMLGQRMFSRKDVESMENNSILSAFINNKLVKDIYNNVFPVLAKPLVQKQLTKLYEEYDAPWNTTKNKRDLRNLPTVISNDFLTSIIFNYGKVDGKNIMEVGKDFIIRNGDKMTMVDRLTNFKKQSFYKELAREFPVLDRFISNKKLLSDVYDLNGFNEPFTMENIQFVKNPSETLLEQENVIEQLRNLYMNYEHKGSTEEENQKRTQRVRAFMKDLFITGMIQSGLGKSFMSFAEYIPVEFKLEIYKGAMAEFEKLDSESVAIYMNQFRDQFKINNPKLFPSFRTLSGENVNNGNKYSDRFKYYKLRPLSSEELENVADDLDVVDEDFSTDWEPTFENTIEEKSSEIPLLTQAIVGTKKEPMKRKLADGIVDAEGYPITFKEYPKFKAYAVKDGDTNKWYAIEASTGLSLSTNYKTKKELLESLPNYINDVYKKGGNVTVLNSVGLFVTLESGQTVGIKC